MDLTGTNFSIVFVIKRINQIMAYKLTIEKYAALKSEGGPYVLMWEDVSLYVWAAIIK